MEKVAPSERFRSELDEVLASVAGEQDPIETVGRLGARLILQQALEDEVTEFLGRSRYERTGETVSHRNGHEPKTIKTTSGSMNLERPLAFGRDMIARGLRAPALVIADGAPGIWKAVRELWPAALEQRCTVHAPRNVTSKLPERHHQEVKSRWWRAFDEARSPGEAGRELQGIVADYKAAYPSAMDVIDRDLPALITHLRFPSEHRKRIRTTNLLERTFVEVRRRTKVIGRFPGETSALSLIWAVLELSSRGWRGAKMNPTDQV